MEIKRNKKVVLKGYVRGSLRAEDMEVVAVAGWPELPEGSSAMVVKNLYLSCDPYMRLRMAEQEPGDSYLFGLVPGEPIQGLGVCKVVSSKHPSFKEGDLVWGMTRWEEYSLAAMPETFFRINFPDLPLSHYTGILGMAGFVAYIGFHEICSPKKGDNIFVSAASGAVGQIVGQLAKNSGCYVVGSAGSDEKVRLLKEKFGFDEAFNYKKEPDLNAALKRCLPAGIDVYFDNVGGAMLDAVLLNMNDYGRIAACGMISQYNLDEFDGVRNLILIVTKRLRVEGYIIFDHFHPDRYHPFETAMATLIREGKVMPVEDVVEGLENGPAALAGLFSGHNVGKQLVVVARE